MLLNIFSAVFSNIIPVLIAVIVFSVLVVVHEFGHFILAKKNGIVVEEFAVGMGPLLYGKQKGETLYSVRALPLGGFCRMLGEDEKSDRKGAFNTKGVLARISVVIAGPLMNFLFALIIICVLISADGFINPVLTKVADGYGAQASGMMEGDRIISIDGKKISVYEDLQFIMDACTGENLQVGVKRGNEKLTFTVTPKKDPQTGKYLIGFTPQYHVGYFSKGLPGYEKAGFLETLTVGTKTMGFYIRTTVEGFIQIFTRQVSKDEVSGPIGIIKVIGDSYEVGIKDSVVSALKNIAYLAALLSANLGALNLFPIPALDGGRLFFLLIEGVRGKPIDREKEGMVHFAGFVLLMVFMVFVAYNDIANIFFR